MTTFSFNPVTPHPLLQPYIAKMWVFESSGRLSALDRKLIVPNANFKLAFTSRNRLVARVDNKTFTKKENELSFTGLVDTAVMLDPKEDAQTERKAFMRELQSCFTVIFVEVKDQAGINPFLFVILGAEFLGKNRNQ